MLRSRPALVAATLAIPLLASTAWAQPAGAPPPAGQAPTAQPGGWFPPPGSAPPPAGPAAAPPPPVQPVAPPAATPASGQPSAGVAVPPAPPAPPEKPREYPARLRWDEGDPIPAGYEPTSRPRTGLLVTGAVLFGVAYLPSLAIAAGDEDTDYLPLAIPFAGPFVTMGTAQSQDAATFWLAVDGITQIAGGTMFIASFIARQSSLKKQDTPLIGVASGPHANLGVGPGSMTMKGAF